MRLPPEAPMAGPILDRVGMMEEIPRVLQAEASLLSVYAKVSIGTVSRERSRAPYTSRFDQIE